ncbi:MAG TPA: type II toxin-antitoxin system VapC family toxin [Nocardioidaceae bacterium]|nr:type II toxin-antitoxin system VapC family toxin [Nocardioidaceae bacterium]
MTDQPGGGVVVDTSAAVAVILGEDGAERIVGHLETAGTRLMSTAGRLELGIVIEARFGRAGGDAVERFLRDAAIRLVDVDADAAERAMGAWRRYGKGRHRAALNYGDCFAYALAERSGMPLLCTGQDFAATDLDVLPG